MIARFFRGMGYFGRGWRVAFGAGARGALRAVAGGDHRRGRGRRHAPGLSLGGTTSSRATRRGMARCGARSSGSSSSSSCWRRPMCSTWRRACWPRRRSPACSASAPSTCTPATRSRRSRWREVLALSLRGLGQAILGVLLYLAIAVPLFVVQWFVPVVAPFVWIAGVVQAALFFAFDAFNEPLHRRGASFGGKWRFIGDAPGRVARLRHRRRAAR